MAAQPDRVITIPEAIAKAEDALRQPELLFDTVGARRVILGLLAALQVSPTYYKAMKQGRQVFVLWDIDRAAPFGIAAWAKEASAHGCPQQKVEDAHAIQRRWLQQPLELTRWPD